MNFTRGHALIIGIGAYQNLPQLNVPATVADAQAVAAALRDPQLCGYPAGQVALLCDGAATRAGLLGALDDLAARAGADDTVFLFYSGHGHGGANGAYSLMSYDSQIAPDRTLAGGVSQQELLGRLRALPARRVLLIFNACHAGAITPTLAAEDSFTGQSLPDDAGAALLATGEGRIIITACRERQYSFVGGGERTIFGQALADGLRGEGIVAQRGYISAFDLYTRLYFAVGDAIRRDVPEAVRARYGETQEPELTVLKGVGPFAVALYRGAEALGDFDAPSDPPAGAAREVTAEQSRALYDRIVQIGAIYQGPVTQVAGPQRNVSTGGGAYVEGDQHQQGVFISGGAVYGPVIGAMSGGTVLVSGAPGAARAQPPALADALAQIRAAATQAQQRGDADDADELQRIALDVAAALRAQESGDDARRRSRVERAQRDLDLLVEDRPALHPLADLLRSA